ncbi:hypothetical protein DYB37_002816 [Aphanomyces astaci]|uniref:GH16 domain-containing protein n=1 Tax=Aphanomyces astaci TaxID=112090 RepID=A0A418FS76_APHAT|nr:hypothetical protein DYB37_002816 [Aphanomyces astaci]
MMGHVSVVAVVVLVMVRDSMEEDMGPPTLPTRSGVEAWVDVDTPEHARRKQSSRGDDWQLVMSDEFNRDNRSFVAGEDHLWTALDIPDGVNAALGWYNSSNVYTKDGRLVVRVDEGPRNATYFNQWLEIPAWETRTMLPGAVDAKSWNPHVRKKVKPTDPITDVRFYPTWPGVWLMGNLGRALFSGSTTRMWPWSFNECDHALAPHQAINACNGSVGFGLNPYQGRGAPELDVLEGGGVGISSSLQIAPGMPDAYRTLPPITTAPYYDVWYCTYTKTCRTPGANLADAPTSMYVNRTHKSWYQGLRYAANLRCPSNRQQKQSFDQSVHHVEIPKDRRRHRVMGPQGYARWMLDDNPIFEVPASSVEKVPQGGATPNPSKLMIEEPLYLIMNIAVAKSWGPRCTKFIPGPLDGPTVFHSMVLVGVCAALLLVTCVLRAGRMRSACAEAHHRRELRLNADDDDECDDDGSDDHVQGEGSSDDSEGRHHNHSHYF